jgi:NAD(P)H-hydrate epimerase
MKAARADEMRAIDSIAINEWNVSGLVLMENAGVQVANKIGEIVGNLREKKICVFAGKGNNGGDGFVVARHLHNKGAKVKVFILGNRENISGDAAVNLEILSRSEVDIVDLITERDWDKAKFAAAFADCLLDALVGTGFHGEISGDMAEVVKLINSAAKPVVAVDIPSGVDADSGQIRGICVRANYTVTLALVKPGLLLEPGATFAGEVTVADIGIPVELVRERSLRVNVITEDYIREVLPKRQAWAHKGSCGRALVVAGSRGLTGAATLASSAVARAGAGLVTLGIPASLNPIMEQKVTEVMTRPLPETDTGCLSSEAISYINELADNCDVLAIGPGMGRNGETEQVIKDIVAAARCPLVIDADALNALLGCTELLPQLEALAVLTPHVGEMSRLTGIPAEQINADRLAVAGKAAISWGTIVVLKGPGTIVAFPDGEAFINTTGNAGMATGGTGDVLTGVIAGFIAQGLSSHEAALAGVYIHGLAGDIAARKGTIGLMAGDVLQAIPEAIQIVQKSLVNSHNYNHC